MIRHVVRIFRHSFVNWLPAIFVVALISVFIGVCINQFVWTRSSEFLDSARASGIDPEEFGAVSLTIYAFIALLALFALTIVGGATVERTRQTFAQWRLQGATPRQIRTSMWLLVGMASALGAVPGSILSVGVSIVSVPLFNELAALSFTNGSGSGGIDLPTFRPAASAWFAALLISTVTCWIGAVGPSLRAARLDPIEAIRKSDQTSPRRGWLRWVVFAVLLLAATGIAFASPFGAESDDFGVRAGDVVNGAMQVGILATVAAFVCAPRVISGILAVLIGMFPLPALGQMAARSIRSASGRSASIVAPLVAAIGAGAMLFTIFRTYEVLISTAGFDIGSPNYLDTAVLTGLFAAVSLITSVSVMTLSELTSGTDQAILRTAGATPRQVSRLLVWQSGLLTAIMGILALLPVGCSGLVLGLGARKLVRHWILVVPWSALGLSLLVTFGVLFVTQRWHIGRFLQADVAVVLRRA